MHQRCLILLLLTFPLLASAQTIRVYGTITTTNGETIIGASIVNSSTGTGTTSNEYGFYSIELPSGKQTILVTAVGKKPLEKEITYHSDTRLDLILEDLSRDLETIIVRSDRRQRNLRTPQMSMERINVAEIRNVPVLFGERDVLKTMQLLPGVKSAGEGNSGFYVRGGAADQNLVLLDEAPVYNASHLFGFFSTFNSDAIKNVTLYKGGMPAQYGGRLSSVVDIKMNDGNNQEFGMSGGIGLIASRLNLEGPLQKGRSSFLLSGRRTYADVFLKLLGDRTLRKAQLYFYDLNAKVNFQLNENNRLYLSGYFGRDVLKQDKLTGIDWGNATGTLRWNHIFNTRLFANTSLIHSNYDYRININSESAGYRITSRIRDWNLKQEFQWHAGSNHTLLMGVNAIHHTIRPGEISVTSTSGSIAQGLQNRYSLDNALYASDQWSISDNLQMVLGFCLSAFTILGQGDYYNLDNQGRVTDTIRYQKGEVVKTYWNPEPRLSISYLLSSNSSIKASYTRNVQNLHLISGSTTTSPTDKWVASTNIIQPGIADQWSIGYYKSLGEQYELSAETYYKSMQNQVDYRNGARIFSNEAIETQLLFGKGRAYGIEWLVKKHTGRLNGWISYTLSKTERKINGINNNQWYNARQDRTHDIAIVGIYQLNSRWTLSANWIYYTGDAVTYPDGKYMIDGEVYFSYSSRNAHRMPHYHRLDLGATKILKKGRKFSSELNFSLYNAYGRANAWQISFRESEDDPQKTEAVKTSLFTFIPSITYHFKF